MRNSTADTKATEVEDEVLQALEQIPLQPLESPILEQTSTLQAVELTMPKQVEMP